MKNLSNSDLSRQALSQIKKWIPYPPFLENAASRNLAHQLQSLSIQGNIVFEHNLVYIANQKSGCSTIKHWLARLQHQNSALECKSIHKASLTPDIRKLHYKPAVELILGDGVVFSFVRHPVSRIISCYQEKIQGSRVSRVKSQIQEQRHSSKKSEVINFEDFISIISEQPPEFHNRHYRAQVSNLLVDRINYDFIGKLENFQNDIRSLEDLVKLPQIPWEVKNVSKGKKSKERIKKQIKRNDLLMEKIFKLYEKDFEKFGYDPDDF